MLTQTIDCRWLDSRRHSPRLPFCTTSITTQAPKPCLETSTGAIQESMEQVERLQDQIQANRRRRRRRFQSTSPHARSPGQSRRRTAGRECPADNSGRPRGKQWSRRSQPEHISPLSHDSPCLPSQGNRHGTGYRPRGRTRRYRYRRRAAHRRRRRGHAGG